MDSVLQYQYIIHFCIPVISQRVKERFLEILILKPSILDECIADIAIMDKL